MPNYEKEITGLLLIDPYNDFTSEGGKVWDRLKGVAERTSVFLTCCKFWKPREGGYPSLLYATPPISPRRLRDVEVYRADSEGGLVTKDLRIRHVGRRDPPRVPASAGRYRGERALMFQRLRQH